MSQPPWTLCLARWPWEIGKTPIFRWAKHGHFLVDTLVHCRVGKKIINRFFYRNGARMVPHHHPILIFARNQVNLGAGFDTLYFWLREDAGRWRDDLFYFEVDFPEVLSPAPSGG